MALHYLLDGYNITKQLPLLALKEFQNGRDSLICLIENFSPQGSRHNEVTIIFDGRPGRIDHSDSTVAKVIFSYDISADEKIREIIKSSGRQKEIIVVTNDKELRFSVCALGAKAVSIEDFFKKITDKETERRLLQEKRDKDAESKNISKTLESKINSELEKIWLKKDEK